MCSSSGQIVVVAMTILHCAGISILKTTLRFIYILLAGTTYIYYIYPIAIIRTAKVPLFWLCSNWWLCEMHDWASKIHSCHNNTSCMLKNSQS